MEDMRAQEQHALMKNQQMAHESAMAQANAERQFIQGNAVSGANPISGMPGPAPRGLPPRAPVKSQ